MEFSFEGLRYYLSKAEVFHGLTPQEMGEIETSARLFTSPKGTLLYTPEDSGEALFLLKRGKVRLYRLSLQGRRITLAEVGEGACFGEISLTGLEKYSSFAEVTEESLLCSFPREAMMRWLSRYPRVTVNLLQAVGKRLTEAEQRLEEVVFLSVPARLAALLLRLPRSGQGEIIGFAHSDLAEIIGSHRETVTQVLSDFEAQGWVRCGRKSIAIADESGLRRVATQSLAGTPG